MHEQIQTLIKPAPAKAKKTVKKTVKKVAKRK
jgi:hypothetical protein